MIDDNLEKPKKPRVTTEDKLRVLLDEHYVKVEKMIEEKMESYNYRVYNSFKAEMRRWLRGYYDNFNG